MQRRMLTRSLHKNRLVSVIMAAFMALAAALLGAALVLALGVMGAVDGFMNSARTPHFMQMHMGELDAARLSEWADQRTDVAAWEVIDYLNVENSQLALAGRPLDAELQQNGFVTQPRSLDYLLSPTGERLEPAPGEVYVPFYHEHKYGLQPGDLLTVTTETGSLTLTVAGTFRDSQMNSTLASSKRLLVSLHDYSALAGLTGGEPEHLISFRLVDAGAASAFEGDYFAAGLENNGPALSWSMFRLINSINDLVTVLLFLLMSAVVLVVTFLVVRYTLLTTLEEDLREIGVMKALGVSSRRIGNIYLGKYRVLLGAGAAVGLAAALLARPLVLAGVQRNLGEVGLPLLGGLAAVAGALLLFGLATLFVARVLHRLRRLTPLQALGQEAAVVSARLRPRPTLAPTTGARVNLKLAWAGMRSAPAAHLTVLAVALLTTLALLVPFRFGSTVRSAEFVTYMGIGQYDLRIDLLGQEDALGAAAALRDVLGNDPRVERLEAFVQETETVRAANGTTVPVRVDYGDHAAFPLRYSSGRAPATTSELALSELNSEALALAAGDQLTLYSASGTATFTVSGVYQDVTNGGKTAKALPGPTMDAAKPSVMLALNAVPGADLTGLKNLVASTAAGANALDSGTFVQQMLGDLIRVMDGVAWVFAFVAVLLAALMAGLGVRLMLVRERKEYAVMTALGFTHRDLRWQYLARLLLPVGVGALVGLLLATPVGNAVGNVIFGVVGISGLQLHFAPVSTFAGSALVITAALISTLTTLSTAGAEQRGRLVASLRA